MTIPETPNVADPKRDKPDTRPFSIRLTEDEKRLLLLRAGRLPLGTYIRDLILAEGMQAKRRRLANPVKDHDALARVLACLGQSRVASNLNQLAKAINFGILPVTPQTERDLSEACSAVAAMRRDLMQALGLAESSRS